MSGDMFYTGRRKQTKGALSVNMNGGSDLVKRLRELETGGEKIIKKTINDFSSRAPAWVSKGIREHYGVDNVAIKDAGPKKKRGATSIKIGGNTVDGVALVYEGRTLTLRHFKMSPKSMPTERAKKQIKIPGQAIAGAGDVAMIRPPKKYKVRATIIKGQRVKLPDNTFIASSNGSPALPFQRTGPGRMPIEAVRTLSVPQMIEGRARETVQEKVGEGLEKRFQHHVSQFIK